MGQAECKKCSPGTYVSVDRQPGSTASDCRACPYGECKQGRCYLNCHPFSTQSINSHNQRHYIARKPRRASDYSFLFFGLFLWPIVFCFSSLFALFFFILMLFFSPIDVIFSLFSFCFSFYFYGLIWEAKTKKWKTKIKSEKQETKKKWKNKNQRGRPSHFAVGSLWRMELSNRRRVGL